MNKLKFLALISIVLMIVSCKDEDPVNPVGDTFDPAYNASIDAANFVAVVQNPFHPLSVGSTFTYSSQTVDGTERVEIEVLAETRLIKGITCTVLRDIAYLNNEIIEVTYDWFAQDKDGNVWYFGEDVDNYVAGVVDNHDGSWEAGVNGAEPGIVMLANPIIGLHYRQEFYKDEAEDRGEVVSRNETITTLAGTFVGCVKIRETNALDADFLEYKYYAPNVGLVKVDVVVGSTTVSEELTAYDVK